ncbi:RNA polymerase sigma factor [Parasegetibacter sp. NRK P23]|uniref:RNA polymerase sigma factor n=1 Tax=Parasegetibacter sp. NRK P23 TaxID=2942999 RepID=UPI002044A745|nr:sigma-70 family RNA polymerase sigma factor [Parasegetibacter sp. NRK P23]MCM5527357.1 sigma-70 family RNA polymerase sigma factor [Parasegetibacter sp. NRK P23]
MMQKYHDDSILLDALNKGEEQAVRHLFHLYYPSLRYFATGIVVHTQEAEDIAIRVFQKFIEKKSGFSSIPAIRSFLYTSVKNAAIDFLRKEHTRLKKAEEIGYLVTVSEEIEDEKMLEAKVLQLIYEEVERLPTQCSIIFKAYFFEGKDTASIALAMGLSPQTVLNQKSKAIAHLRSFIRKQGVIPAVAYGFIVSLVARGG